MEETKAVRKITDWSPIGRRPKGPPKNRWRDDMLKDLKKFKLNNRTCLVTGRKAWYKVMQKTKTHLGLSW
jgi:hypothetical protein